MTSLDRQDPGDEPCAGCAVHRAPVDEQPARVEPLRLLVGLLRAAVAVGAVALAARATPDPIDLRPRVLRD